MMPEPAPHAHPGFFLVLDGPDGSGKTTQAAKIADWLRGQGYDVVTCRDPGGTALGERLRPILLDRSAVPISLRAEMLLYMTSRAQLVEEVIAPALAAGKLVVADRYLLANIVYQGTAGGLLEEEIALVGMVATSGLLPTPRPAWADRETVSRTGRSSTRNASGPGFSPPRSPRAPPAAKRPPWAIHTIPRQPY
jgi:hypothetical protein